MVVRAASGARRNHIHVHVTVWMVATKRCTFLSLLLLTALKHVKKLYKLLIGLARLNKDVSRGSMVEMAGNNHCIITYQPSTVA